MTDVSESEIRELAASKDLQAHLGATISGGHLDGFGGELLACQLVGGTTFEQEIGSDAHGDIDILLVADASINTAAVADRLADLGANTVRANGNEATRAGLIASAQGSEPELGPALDSSVTLLVVDAFDKMKASHRTAFTEILDNRSYTITTANHRDSLEGAGAHLFFANPKYGSFGGIESIYKQTDLEPELLEAVDLYYPITQVGEPEGIRLDLDTANAIIEAAQEIEPSWTAGARAELQEAIEEVEARKEDDDVPIPVNTGRLREALRKFSEATARLRFQGEVAEEDVSRAWDGYKRAYEMMGVVFATDDEDAEVEDSDRKIVETGTSKSQRDRIQNLKGIISDIASEYDKGAPIDVIIERAEEVGLDQSKAEHEIEQLKQKGEVYEPWTDHLMTT